MSSRVGTLAQTARHAVGATALPFSHHPIQLGATSVMMYGSLREDGRAVADYETFFRSRMGSGVAHHVREELLPIEAKDIRASPAFANDLAGQPDLVAIPSNVSY